MITQTPRGSDHRLLTSIGMVIALLLFLVGLQSFVLVETYELAAFEAHRSCTERREASCERLLPPWHAADREHLTLRARFAATLGSIPEATLDAADAAWTAVSGAFDALTFASRKT